MLSLSANYHALSFLKWQEIFKVVPENMPLAVEREHFSWAKASEKGLRTALLSGTVIHQVIYFKEAQKKLEGRCTYRCLMREAAFRDQDCHASGHTYTRQQSPLCQNWTIQMRERTAQLYLQAMAMACPSPASMPATLGATCRQANEIYLEAVCLL